MAAVAHRINHDRPGSHRPWPFSFQLRQRRAHPAQILGEGPPARLLVWRDAGPESQIPDCARGVVEPDAVAVEASPDRRLVDLESSVERVLAADVEQEIAKIMVPVRPGGAIVIEDAVDGVGLRIERQIV
jgi:hypothetical protein